MAAKASQPNEVRREQRIIERPRLIRLLDETDARTILLLAPAGYGKTTLARQWAKTLNGAVWVTLSAGDRDVASIAEKLARACAPNESITDSFVAMYLRAHANPQRMAREIALVVVGQLRKNRVQWVVLDDYHEITSQPEAELFFEVLNQELDSRFLISSRLRPVWATARLAVYGDLVEVNRGELAMNLEESRRVLGAHPDFESVVAQADGWPAVIGLAANARGIRFPGLQLSSNLLHNYFTEELFRAAGSQLQQQLMRLAVAPDLAPDTLAEAFGSETETLLCEAREFGFINPSAEPEELHPLIRDFLFEKLASAPQARTMITDSVEACVRRGRWERAFELILRFERDDLVEPVLEAAYTPLIRSGHTGTLAAFAAKVRVAPNFPPAVVDLAEADIALADGAFDLASRIAQRAVMRLGDGHGLVSRGHTIIAESAYARAQLSAAELAYRSAHEFAHSKDDRIAALRGWALSSLQGEVPVPSWVMQELEERRSESPHDLLRHTILELTRLHFTGGYAAAQPLIDEAEGVLEQVDDPRARSSFAHVAAYVSALACRYPEARRWQNLCDADISAFDLDFARPHSFWNHAHIALGLRKFGAAERMLQRLEDVVSDRPLDYHVLNARILRSRLALQTGKIDAAIGTLPTIKREAVIPSVHGEYLALRGLALAVAGRTREAIGATKRAEAITRAVEVRVMTAATRAIACDTRARKNATRTAWDLAENLQVWDPLLAATRASRTLAEALAGVESLRPALACLYQRSNDLGLARRAGLRARASGAPADLLSPREHEVLELLARGYRNQDIADALVVSLSTVKVHVRHIFEKLGVRSRSEAVTRLATMS